MSKRIDGIGEQVMDKTHDIGVSLHDIATIVRDAVEDKFREVVKGARAAGEKGRDSAIEARDEIAAYVGDRPIKSVLVAASIGFALGALLRRR